ncbi:MAG: hypothetical protein HY720_27030 [Planctomycetes bacterium]|nr:hypothetical protein [Planctomycetota bacterium]
MNRILAFASAVAFVLGASAAAQETYTFNKDAVPQAGWKFLQSGASKMDNRSEVKQGEQVLQQQDQKQEDEYAGVVEILAVEGDEMTEGKITFQTATSKGSEGEKNLDLAGKTVIAKGKEGARTFTFADGSALSADQQAFVKEHFDEEKKEGAPEPEDLFFPDHPVSVGQCWDVPMEDLVKVFAMGPDAVDQSKSSASVTFESVSDQYGTKFATLRLSVSFAITKVEQITMDDAKMVVSGTIEVPIDGSVPYEKMGIEMDFNGAGSVEQGGQKITVTFQVQNSQTGTKVPVE